MLLGERARRATFTLCGRHQNESGRGAHNDVFLNGIPSLKTVAQTSRLEGSRIHVPWPTPEVVFHSPSISYHQQSMAHMGGETYNIKNSRSFYMIHVFVIPSTYDHRVWRTGLPVRSAVLKPHAGRLVVGWVTTSESLLLYVFLFFFFFFFESLFYQHPA